MINVHSPISEYMDNINNNSAAYENNAYPIAMSVNPMNGIELGNYTLTIGARYVTYSQMIDLVVTK
jgi:hypothetical protein